MPQTILQMVQNAEMELGLPVATSVFGQNGTPANTDIQLGALANRVLDELRRVNRWTALQFEYDIVVTPVITTTGNMQPQSPIITNIPSTSGISAWSFACQGPGVPAAARVLSVDSPTQITMTMENTNTAALTNQTVQFAQDTYPMPVGFSWYNNRTMWDRTNRWELLGPDSPQMDQWHRSGIVVTGPRRHFRQLGPGVGTYADQFRIWPAPYELVNPLQLVFEYLSNAAVNSEGEGTTFAQYFINDSDTCLLDENALIIGMKWMFWEVKGFGAYATMQSRWVDYVDRLVARDGGAPTLNVVKRVNPIFISPANVQDGFFPGPSGPNMG
jgi:hypothetical protein